MSRPLRVQRPDAWYHITGRATERRVIFRTDRDYFHWLELILELTERFRLQVLAYAMMAQALPSGGGRARDEPVQDHAMVSNQL